MATAEHREPCDSRGSRTVLGAPGGEIPPGDSTHVRPSAQSAVILTGLPVSNSAGELPCVPALWDACQPTMDHKIAPAASRLATNEKIVSGMSKLSVMVNSSI